MTEKAERMTMSADEAAAELEVNVKAVYTLAHVRFINIPDNVSRRQ